MRQNDAKTIGDSAIKTFAGSVALFATSELIKSAIDKMPGSELTKLLVRNNVAQHLGEEYALISWFITNGTVDKNGFRASDALKVTIFDREKIVDRYIEIDAPDVVEGTAEFDVSDNGFVEFSAGDKAKLYLLTAKASDFLKLGGIADGSLFAQNVRLHLGNTKVNKDILKTIRKSSHQFFPMYHNGITMICRKVESGDSIRVHDYVVVNGAQSLAVINQNRDIVSDDLRLVVKIIEIEQGDEEFARKITLASNNQNAIRPRDQRSTNVLQVRLKSEFEQIDFKSYRYGIKRGQDETGHTIINEEAGRLMMAFDLCEPWSCHQIYKVFDQKHSEVFGRPVVNAWHIILLTEMMAEIQKSLNVIEHEPIQGYRLTRYFLL